MPQEKVRIYTLAHELQMESKALIELCQQNGINIKNQLSSVEPELRDQIVALVKRKASAPATPAPAAVRGPAPLPKDINKPLKNLDRRPAAKREGETAPPVEAPRPPEAPKAPVAPPAQQPPAVQPAQKAPPPKPEITAPPTPPAPVAPPAAKEEAKPAPAAKEEKPAPPPGQVPPTPPAAPVTPLPRQAPPPHAQRPLRDLNRPQRPLTPPGTPRPVTGSTGGGSAGTTGGGDAGRRPAPNILRRDGGRGPAPRPPQGQAGTGPRPVPPQPLRDKPAEKKPTAGGARKLADISADVSLDDARKLLQQPAGQHAPGRGAAGPQVIVPPGEDESDDDDKKKGAHKRPGSPGAIVGRDERHKERAKRAEARKGTDSGSRLTGRDINTLLAGEEIGTRVKKKLKKKEKQPGTLPPKGKIRIAFPITVRSLSETIGKRANDILGKLMQLEQGKLYNINASLEPELAQMLALEYGIELDVFRIATAEEKEIEKGKQADNPEDLRPRAPIVAVMGHVDHGKTSLLDKIRQQYGHKSNVVATEAGGITQVLRAWRVEKDGKPVTFLDTPGHQAFTQMRARGANVTDIAVIVVAADDGVMPQTEEAISHAKAAGVSIVVSINKIDMPAANIRKTEQQLYGLGLIPDTMGGDVPFVQTSAVSGKGVAELLDHLSVVAELKELKANPNKPASGVCLEAHKSEGEGVSATILVQDGTLRRGDVVLCGACYGRVRAMYSDLGEPLEEAGPSIPVRITGLNDVPNADDPFQVVEDLTVAAEIAEKRQARLREATMKQRVPLDLTRLAEAQIAELKVILKTDARGSIEAIRNELEKFQHDEVRLRLLHAAVGGITESDVQLALTSPEDTLVVGFNAVPDNQAMALAEQRGIQIREYDIIYKLTDDIRAALEGKLKPREEVVHLGRAIVRETFKISRVGTIAGCYVTQGTIERSAKVRVIRNGVVIYPPADRTASLESLKRFKDDVREVREGFECGIKIAGYDDIKVDDVIEAYRIEQVQRTLS